MYKSMNKKKKKLEWKLVWSLCEIKQVQITCVGKNGSNYQIFVFLFVFVEPVLQHIFSSLMKLVGQQLITSALNKRYDIFVSLLLLFCEEREFL